MLADAYVAILTRHMITRHFFRCGFLAFRECDNVAAFLWLKARSLLKYHPHFKNMCLYICMQCLYIVCVCSSEAGQLGPAAPKLRRFLCHRFLLRLLFLSPVLPGAPSAGEGRKTVFPPGCERSVMGYAKIHTAGCSHGCWMQWTQWWLREAGCNGCSKCCLRQECYSSYCYPCWVAAVSKCALDTLRTCTKSVSDERFQI